jgi:predicted Zn-dependent peptidase
MKKPIIKTLDNGLRIIAIPHFGESVTVEVLVNTGSQFETAEKNGISHFLEHMCFKGTKTSSGKDIMHFLDGLGSRTNAFTDDEVTGYYIKSAKKHWKKTLTIVADIFQNPLFPKDEIQREKGVITGEIDMYNDDPSSVAGDLFETTLYGDQPAGWKILGPKKNILNMTQKDFIDYHNTYYTANNAVVVVVGNLDTKDIFSEVENLFSKLSTSLIPKKKRTLIIHEQKIAVDTKKTQQSHIVIGYPTVGNNHKDALSLSMLAVLLGGGMSSRLFEKIREELGAGYYIYTSHYAHTDSGSLRIVSGLDSKRVPEVLQHIAEIITDIQGNGITEKELKKVREYMSGSLIMSMESPSAQSHYYGYRLLQGREIITPKEIIKNLKNITAKDLQKIAKKYLNNKKIRISLVGPHDREQSDNILNIFNENKKTTTM